MTTENSQERTDYLISSFLKDKVTAEELAELRTWLSQSSSNKTYFKESYMVWKAGAISGQPAELAERAFEKLNCKIELRESGPDKIDTKRASRSISVFIRWAAVIFISVGIGTVLGFIIRGNHLGKLHTIALNEINVPLGSQSRIVLPDSTEVWLNAGSKLTYTEEYGKINRTVHLEGEGYFKVFKNPEKPFIVETKKAKIRALGTEFNVKAYPDEDKTETFLVKGSVIIDKITPSKSEEIKSVLLKPGQKLVIVNDPEKRAALPKEIKAVAENQITKDAPKDMGLQNSIAEIETSWKDASWVIQGENINDLCIKLGRRFNVSIVHIDQGLGKYQFSGTIQKETLEQVFDLIKLTIPLSYSIEKGMVKITLNSRLEDKYKRAYHN
jgi:ferric-dicitrate binding protein FerR (iron transport regulator)